MEDCKLGINIDILYMSDELHDGDRRASRAWLYSPSEDFNGVSPYDSCTNYNKTVKLKEYLEKKLKQKNGF